MPVGTILLVVLWSCDLRVPGSFTHLSQAAADLPELTFCTLITRKARTTRKLPAGTLALAWKGEGQQLLCQILLLSYDTHSVHTLFT